jgi:DNA-binding MarR family transcriptional regulator
LARNGPDDVLPASQRLRADEQLGDVLEFMRRLWAVDHGLESTSKYMELRHGVTGPQRMALRLLGCYPDISARELAELMHLHPSTLTGILRRLEERGYIVREVDENDRRRAVLGLTARGRQLDYVQPGTVEAAVHRVLARIGQKPLATAAAVLSLLAQELEASTTP